MFRKISLYLLLYILVIIAFSIASFFCFMTGANVWGIACGAGTLFFISKTLTLYNSVNRKIAYFFEAMENDDYSINFIERKGTSSEMFLSYILNKMKNILRKTRIESQQQEKFYELILESINSGIVVLNPQGFVLRTNAAALKLLGLGVFTHLRQLDRVDPALTALFGNIKSGDKKTFSLTMERGTVQLSIKATGLWIDKEAVRLVVIHDINNEMDEKEIESWIKLIRVLSHEIMNSIAPITSLSDTLLTLYEDEHVADCDIRNNAVNGLHVISETSKGLVSFVESYRKFTRIPTPEKELFNVSEFIQRIVILCSAENNFKSVKIDMTKVPEDLKLYADSNLLGQVMINIVKNAIQALQGRADACIEIAATKTEEDRTVFTIKDNGPGIPEELMKQIFVPFFTTKEQGSGIGLSIARQIMRAHDGSIRVHSVPDKETRFTIEL